MFGKGLQVDKTPPPPPPNPYSNVYLPQSGRKFPMYPPPFYGNWVKLLEWVKKQVKAKRKLERVKIRPGIVIRKKQSVQQHSNSWKHFVNKPLSNF